MKAVITALAVTAMLATSAVAKPQRTKAVRAQPNNSVVQANRVNSAFCQYHHAHADPDPRVRLQLLRDCRSYESSAPF
jgi:hypothetical protein